MDPSWAFPNFTSHENLFKKKFFTQCHLLIQMKNRMKRQILKVSRNSNADHLLFPCLFGPPLPLPPPREGWLVGTIFCHVPCLLANITRAIERPWRLVGLYWIEMWHRSKGYWVCWSHHAQPSSKKLLRGWWQIHLWDHALGSLRSLPHNPISQILLSWRYALSSTKKLFQLLHSPAMGLIAQICCQVLNKH